MEAGGLGRGLAANRGRVIFRSNNHPDGNGMNRRNNKPFNRLHRSSLANINMVKDKLLSRRSTYYDDAKEALVKENNGIRVWYHNYTTIGMDYVRVHRLKKAQYLV